MGFSRNPYQHRLPIGRFVGLVLGRGVRQPVGHRRPELGPRQNSCGDAFNHQQMLWGYIMAEGDKTADRTCYADVKTRKLVALVMLHDCCNIFNQISAILASDKAHTFDKNGRQTPRESPESILTSDSQYLADMIRISMCFETFFKAKLLLYGYLIHSIDENADEVLATRQLQFPINITEVSAEIFNTLSAKTIGWEILVTEGYRKQLDIPPKLFKSLEGIVEIRRHLQYFKSGDKTYSLVPLQDLVYIHMCYRELVVKLHNDLLAQHEEPPMGRIDLQLELQGRMTPGTAFRAFCHKLAEMLR